MSQYDQTAVKQRYGKTPSVEQSLGYLKALKVIIGADGDIADAELTALKKGMQRMGATEDVVNTILDFNIQGVSLESVLPDLKKGGKRARMLIRDAVELSGADGVYAKAEKEAVAKAAQLLGVPAETVKALESLVELEHAARRLRKALLS